MAKERSTHIRRVKLSDYRDKKEDEGAIVIVDDADLEYRIPPPELWSDAVISLSEADDSIGAATLLIGEDRYAEFVKNGGSAMLVLGIVKDEHGVTVPE